MNNMVDAALRASRPAAQAFREAMAQVASAAHIVTTLGPAGRAGLTATAVASVARTAPGADVRPAVVNGAAGVVVAVRGRPFAILGFTVREGRIVEIDAILGAERVGRIGAAVLAA